MDKQLFDQLTAIIDRTNEQLAQTTTVNQQLAERVEDLTSEVQSLRSHIERELYPLVDKYAIAPVLGISPSSIKHKHTSWDLGLHYFQPSPKVVRYNLRLIEDWFKNQGDPLAHRRAIERYRRYVDNEVVLSRRSRKTPANKA